MTTRFRRFALWGTATLTTTATGYAFYQYRTREDLQRAAQLWLGIGPVITHYRLVEFKHKVFPPASEEEADQDWEALHAKYSDRVLETLLNLRGFYIKVGQLVAHRNDILPDCYITKLRTLEDAVPPLLTASQAKDIITQSLNLPSFDAVFSHFSEQPVGSASIGQVHKAIHIPTSHPVAIKIQSPGVESLFRHDIRSAKTFCRIFAPEHLITFEEIEKQFLTEFDYREEARHVRNVRENMKPYKHLVEVPEVYEELCSKEVLTMGFLEGPKLVEGVREVGEEWARRQGTTLKEIEREMRRKYQVEGLPPLYDGPSAFQIEFLRKFLFVKDSLINLPIWMYNVTVRGLGYVPGLGWLPSKVSVPYYKSFVPLNSAHIMDTLLKVHGHQMLINGYVNSDPHPGNFLLLPSKKIGLIDFGQIKTLTPHDRYLLSLIILHLTSSNKPALHHLALSIGYKSKYHDPEVIFKMAVVTFDRDGRDVTDGLNLQQFLDKMYERDPWERGLDVLVMPMRVSLMLRGVGLLLSHPVSVARAWRPFAERVVREYEAEKGNQVEVD
ncbi:hypothetical protein HK102_013404 [Quaeritorhiza haematococci]|nr:hypothetical protein HK102_013404 [Quaeritorhiza haematococci]